MFHKFYCEDLFICKHIEDNSLLSHLIRFIAVVAEQKQYHVIEVVPDCFSVDIWTEQS